MRRKTTQQPIPGPPDPPDSVENGCDPETAAQWAHEQFAGARLPDKRLTKRLVRLGATLVQRPPDSLPQATQTWAETKAAYRLIENERVSKEAILQSVYEATARRCAGIEEILAIQDTTSLMFPRAREAAEDLGYVSDDDLPSLQMHSAMALRENGVALGLLRVNIWARDIAERGKKHERKKRPIEEKESAKWLDGIKSVQHVLDAELSPRDRPRVIHVMDREGDIHEVFEQIDKSSDGAVIRAAQNRRVVGEDQDLDYAHDLVRRQEPLAKRIVEVPRRPGRQARQAKVELRACPVLLNPRSSQRRRIALSLIEVREYDTPADEEPLHWLLWTTEPAASLEEVLRIIEIYKKRWRIEDFHLTLKSGCEVEKLRMHRGERIAKTIAIYAPMAARIVELRDLARTEPEAPCTEVLSEPEWRALWNAIHDEPPSLTADPPNIRQAVLWIGRLGGHLNRKGDGMPGVTTLWRGLRDLGLLAKQYQSIQNFFLNRFTS